LNVKYVKDFFKDIKISFATTVLPVLQKKNIMIYLDMKKLLPGAEILYSRTTHTLEINSRSKKFLVPTCDLQAGLIVLGEDIGIP
jgi:hypothetical protein